MPQRRPVGSRAGESQVPTHRHLFEGGDAHSHQCPGDAHPERLTQYLLESREVEPAMLTY